MVQAYRFARSRTTRGNNNAIYAGCIEDNSTILPRAIVDPKDIFERRCRGAPKWTVADRLLPILRRACRRKFSTFGKANDRTRLIRLVDEIRASMDFKNPDYVVVRVARRRKRVAVRFQQMRAKFFREIRSKRFRIVPLANVAFVYRLAWMQIRGQHVFPKILLKQKRKMTALVGRA